MRKFKIIYGLIVFLCIIIFNYFQYTKSCYDDMNNIIVDAGYVVVNKLPDTTGVIVLTVKGMDMNKNLIEYINDGRVLQPELSKLIQINDTFIKKEGSSTYIIGKKGYRYLFELRCVENKSYTYTFIDSSSSLWKVPDSVLPNKGSETIYYK